MNTIVTDFASTSAAALTVFPAAVLHGGYLQWYNSSVEL